MQNAYTNTSCNLSMKLNTKANNNNSNSSKARHVLSVNHQGSVKVNVLPFRVSQL